MSTETPGEVCNDFFQFSWLRAGLCVLQRGRYFGVGVVGSVCAAALGGRTLTSPQPAGCLQLPKSAKSFPITLSR